jgi:hypothetical protein
MTMILPSSDASTCEGRVVISVFFAKSRDDMLTKCWSGFGAALSFAFTIYTHVMYECAAI